MRCVDNPDFAIVVITTTQLLPRRLGIIIRQPWLHTGWNTCSQLRDAINNAHTQTQNWPISIGFTYTLSGTFHNDKICAGKLLTVPMFCTNESHNNAVQYKMAYYLYHSNDAGRTQIACPCGQGKFYQFNFILNIFYLPWLGHSYKDYYNPLLFWIWKWLWIWKSMSAICNPSGFGATGCNPSGSSFTNKRLDKLASRLGQWSDYVHIKRCACFVHTIFTRGQFWPPGIVVACVRPSVSPSVLHQVCPRDNSSPVQARITKFGP